MTPAECETILRSELPGLSFGHVTSAEPGWSFWTFVVDGEWVFRFPKTEADARLMEREFALLPMLAARLPVAVPRYEHRGKWEGMPFGGYRLIEGEPIAPTANGADRELARQVGEMLTALHNFPPEMAASRWDEPTGAVRWLKHHRAFQAECAERAFPLLPPRDRMAASELFKRFNSELSNPHAATTLTHSDLGLVHILGRDGRLTGVIDWSDAALGDPAIDFAGLLAGSNTTWLHMVIEYYDRPTGERFMERVRYYHNVAPLHDVLYGVASEDRSIVRAGARGFAARTR